MIQLLVNNIIVIKILLKIINIVVKILIANVFFIIIILNKKFNNKFSLKLYKYV